MLDAIIVVRNNAYGLTNDASLLAQGLKGLGLDVRIVGHRQRSLFNRITRKPQAKLAVHLERAHPVWFSAALQNWLIPNQERFPHRHIGRLRKIDQVLVKSHHAFEIFSEAHNHVGRLGFVSPDQREEETERNWHDFFHLAGGSTLKGTEQLISLWKRNPHWPKLVLVQKAANVQSELPENVELHSGYMEHAQLKRLQNTYGMHLCPSRAEGWGHHIVEAMSCGALVLTIDGPPMNEHVRPDCGWLVPVSRTKPRHMGTCYYADSAALEAGIQTMIDLPIEKKIIRSAVARQRYEQICHHFEQQLTQIFSPLLQNS